MVAVHTMRHSLAWAWALACLLALLLVLAVLTRVAAAAPGDPPGVPVAVFILCPSDGTFVAGPHPGAEPYVGVGSKLDLGDVVGHIEVWGKLHSVHSMVRGAVIKILASDDAMVTTGQPLFEVQLEEEPNTN